MCTLYLGLATSQNKARKIYVRRHALVRRRAGRVSVITAPFANQRDTVMQWHVHCVRQERQRHIKEHTQYKIFIYEWASERITHEYGLTTHMASSQRTSFRRRVFQLIIAPVHKQPRENMKHKSKRKESKLPPPKKKKKQSEINLAHRSSPLRTFVTEQWRMAGFS